jgi:hypothetical protein
MEWESRRERETLVAKAVRRRDSRSSGVKSAEWCGYTMVPGLEEIVSALKQDGTIHLTDSVELYTNRGLYEFEDGDYCEYWSAAHRNAAAHRNTESSKITGWTEPIITTSSIDTSESFHVEAGVCCNGLDPHSVYGWYQHVVVDDGDGPFTFKVCRGIIFTLQPRVISDFERKSTFGTSIATWQHDNNMTVRLWDDVNNRLNIPEDNDRLWCIATPCHGALLNPTDFFASYRCWLIRHNFKSVWYCSVESRYIIDIPDYFVLPPSPFGLDAGDMCEYIAISEHLYGLQYEEEDPKWACIEMCMRSTYAKYKWSRAKKLWRNEYVKKLANNLLTQIYEEVHFRPGNPGAIKVQQSFESKRKRLY